MQIDVAVNRAELVAQVEVERAQGARLGRQEEAGQRVGARQVRGARLVGQVGVEVPVDVEPTGGAGSVPFNASRA